MKKKKIKRGMKAILNKNSGQIPSENPKPIEMINGVLITMG